MTLLSFFGCTFVAFGPSFSIFVLTVAPDAQQVIVFISSAFFWLLSLLLSSSVWYILHTWTTNLAYSLILSVLFQEVFRYFFWMLLRRAEEGLLVMTNSHSPLRKLYFHYVASFGFGVMSGLFSMVNVLADIAGPGTVGLYGDSQFFPVYSAFLTNCIILLHTFWGIVFFEGCDNKKYRTIIVVVACHLLVSGLTLLNKSQTYWPSLVVGYVMACVMSVWSFYSVGGTVDALKRAIFSKRDISNR